MPPRKRKISCSSGVPLQIYVCTIELFHPDYKRPYSSIYVKIFLTKEKAIEWIIEEILDTWEEYNYEDCEDEDCKCCVKGEIGECPNIGFQSPDSPITTLEKLREFICCNSKDDSEEITYNWKIELQTPI